MTAIIECAVPVAIQASDASTATEPSTSTGAIAQPDDGHRKPQEPRLLWFRRWERKPGATLSEVCITLHFKPGHDGEYVRFPRSNGWTYWPVTETLKVKLLTLREYEFLRIPAPAAIGF